MAKRRLALASVGVLLGLVACSAPESSAFGDGPPGKNGKGADGQFDGSDPSTPPEFAQCATKTSATEPLPVYLVFMFDKSESMVYDGSPKWAAATAAARTFFESDESAGVSASLSYFPDRVVRLANDVDYTCDVNDYSRPHVMMSGLPSGAFRSSFQDQQPIGGTPTYVALYGAVQYAQTIAANVGRNGRVAVVLATDGLPDSKCGLGTVDQELEAVAKLAGEVKAAVPTYVIGVGNQLNRLGKIAISGGTEKAYIVDAGDASQIQRDFLGAITKIRSTLACDYDIPAPPDGQQIDRDAVNVLHRSPNGTKAALSRNPSCADGSGWRYDDPNDPKRIMLCDGSCSAVRAGGGSVEVLFGCATKNGAIK
jgi:hypothetical protein